MRHLGSARAGAAAGPLLSIPAECNIAMAACGAGIAFGRAAYTAATAAAQGAAVRCHLVAGQRFATTFTTATYAGSAATTTSAARFDTGVCRYRACLSTAGRRVYPKRAAGTCSVAACSGFCLGLDYGRAMAPGAAAGLPRSIAAVARQCARQLVSPLGHPLMFSSRRAGIGVSADGSHDDFTGCDPDDVARTAKPAWTTGEALSFSHSGLLASTATGPPCANRQFVNAVAQIEARCGLC